MDEVRTTNETTGGQKGTKLARFDLIPTAPLWDVAELYGKGALKYAPNNWRKGYDWSLSYAALQRHAAAFWSGEDLIPEDPNDPTSGSPHLAAVAWHALTLLEWIRTHPELDDRPSTKRHGEDLAWLVGIIEGEGSFTWHAAKGGRKGYGRVQVGMTDLDVLQRAQKVSGVGSIHGPYVYKRKNGSPAKPLWDWCVQAQTDVRELLIDLIPRMCERRASRAAEVLALIEKAGVV